MKNLPTTAKDGTAGAGRTAWPEQPSESPRGCLALGDTPNYLPTSLFNKLDTGLCPEPGKG